MTLGGVSSHDIVPADISVRHFYPIVIARCERELKVESIDRPVTYRRVGPRELLRIWHKSRSRTARVASQGGSPNGGSSDVEPVRSDAR